MNTNRERQRAEFEQQVRTAYERVKHLPLADALSIQDGAIAVYRQTRQQQQQVIAVLDEEIDIRIGVKQLLHQRQPEPAAPEGVPPPTRG